MLEKLKLDEINYLKELSDDEQVAVVGGAGLVDLETQLEKLNPQTEIGKTLLKLLSSL